MQGRPVAAARPLQGAHARAAGRRPRRQRRQRSRAARRCSRKALELGKGVMHLLAPLDGLRGAMLAGAPTRADRRGQGVLDQARLPDLRHQLPRARPAHVQLQQQARLVHRPASAPALKLTREQRKAYDDSIRDDDDKGREQSFPAEEAEVEGVVDEPCPDCARHAAEPGVARRSRSTAQSIAEIAQLVGGRRAALGRERCSARPAATREIARDVDHRDQQPARVPRGGRPRLPDAGPRRADALAAARRSASAWRRSSAATCRACATCSTSRRSACTRATTRSCSNALQKLGDKGNTLVVVEHDEDTIRRADHIIDIGPGAGKRGGTLVAEGSAADLSAQRRFGDRALPGASAAPSAAAAPPVEPVTTATERGERRNALLTIRGATLHNLQRRRRRRAAAAPGRGHRRQRLGQVDAGARRAAGQPAVHQHAAARKPNWQGCATASTAGGCRSTACSRSTRRRSARRRARARRPTSASGTRSASSSPTRWKPRRAAMRRRASRFNTGEGRCPACEGPGRAHDRDELPARRQGAVRRLPRRSASTPRRWR